MRIGRRLTGGVTCLQTDLGAQQIAGAPISGSNAQAVLSDFAWAIEPVLGMRTIIGFAAFGNALGPCSTGYPQRES